MGGRVARYLLGNAALLIKSEEEGRERLHDTGDAPDNNGSAQEKLGKRRK